MESDAQGTGMTFDERTEALAIARVYARMARRSLYEAALALKCTDDDMAERIIDVYGQVCEVGEGIDAAWNHHVDGGDGNDRERRHEDRQDGLPQSLVNCYPS